MPSSTKKQARFMAAAAHNPKFAKRVGMKQSVAKDFNRADAGTGILKKAIGGLAAAQQPLGGPPATVARSPRPAPGRFGPKRGMRKPRKGLTSTLKSADQTIAGAGNQLADLSASVSPTPDAGDLGYAGGGKIGTAALALRQLAAKFESALHMQDTDQATRVGRQMDSMQPGASQSVLQKLGLAQSGVAADKLATFKRGGRVRRYGKGGKVGNLVKHLVELTSSPEHSIHDDLKGRLEDSGVPPDQHSQVKIKDYQLVDSDKNDHFYNATLEGPKEHIDKIKSHLTSEGLGLESAED
jgi:hypothetical protein